MTSNFTRLRAAIDDRGKNQPNDFHLPPDRQDDGSVPSTDDEATRVNLTVDVLWGDDSIGQFRIVIPSRHVTRGPNAEVTLHHVLCTLYSRSLSHLRVVCHSQRACRWRAQQTLSGPRRRRRRLCFW